MWTIFKVFIEFVTVLLLFYVLVSWPRSIWDLSSPTRDRTSTACIGRRSLFFLNKFIYLFIFGCVGSSLLHVGF